jgi:hypothetical protein
MDFVTILAQTNRTAGTEPAGEGIVPIDLFWEQITSLGVLEALTFISFGVVCLFYGWRVFKVLVVINFGLLGLILGMAITERIFGPNSQLTGGLITMGLFAVLSVPLMRWAVCILGAAAGGILTSAIWYACGLTETYIWAGALVGIVAGGMISFIIFRAAVILFSSLWGSALTVVGILAIISSKHIGMVAQTKNLVMNHNWFLPVALVVPTAVGLILQHKFVKGSKDWDL